MRRPAFVSFVVRPAFVAVLLAACAQPSTSRADEKPSDFIMSMAEEIARPAWKDGDPRSERLRLHVPEGMIWANGPSENTEQGNCRSYESTSISTGLVVRISACDRLVDEQAAARIREAPEAMLDTLMSAIESTYTECPGSRPEIRSRAALDGAPARVALLQCASPAGAKRVVIGFALGQSVHSVEVVAEGPTSAVEAAMPALFDVALTAAPCNAKGDASACRDENMPVSGAPAAGPPSVTERVRLRWHAVKGWKRAAVPADIKGRCVVYERATQDGAAAQVTACTAVPDPDTAGAKALAANGASAYLDAFVAGLRSGVANCPEQETDLISSEPLSGAPSRLVLITCTHGSETSLHVVRVAVGRAFHEIEATVRGPMMNTPDAFAEVTALMSGLELCDESSDEKCPVGDDGPR